MGTTPAQFANIGLDLITKWQQTTEDMIAFASVYEARGGANQFINAKHAGEALTPEQIAENAELDRLAAAALDVVMHHNELVEWLTAPRKVRIAIRRTDY